MKHILFYIVGFFSFVLMSCGDDSKQKEFELTCNTNTFDAPISCISQSSVNHDKIFIGLEDGSIIEKTKNNWKVYSIEDNHRIYDILEQKNDSLFIGTRDAGLKLLTGNKETAQSFYIKEKNLNYSVYSIAKDSVNNILYLGTSNGLYKLNLSVNDDSHLLQHINLGNETQYFAVNKILVKNKILYVASDLGLFIARNIEKDLVNPVIESATKNITLKGDTVYAITENAVNKVLPNKSKEVIHQGKCCYYNQGLDADEWYVASNSIIYKKNNQELKHELPDGVSTNAKQVALMGEDFLYLACKEKLISFALHQNVVGSGNNVIAVSDKRNGDMIYFITSDLRMHRYKFKYNQPESKSESLGKIKGLDDMDEIVKLVEADNNLFFLATKKRLYKIVNNKATCILFFDDAEGHKGTANSDCINTLYYSSIEHKLYIGTRKYFGCINEQDKRIVIPIPIITSKGLKDTIDSYVVDICEKEDSIYVATLNKGLYGKLQKDNQGSLRLIRDLTKYESTYGLIANGANLYLNTAQGIINNNNATILPIKNVKSIYGVLDKNPNEGYFILYYYGLSFKGLEDTASPLPLFKDLAFNKSCIALNGRKAVLGCKSGLFYYDGKLGLTPIYIEESSHSNIVYIIIASIILVVISMTVFFIHTTKRKKIEDTETPIGDIEADILVTDNAVKALFDQLGNKELEVENNMRKELKQVCLNFVDKYPELGKLSFMKRRGKERYYITVLLLIENVDANIISRVLDIDQMTVNRHKYNARKEIEQLYEKNETNYKVINLLYDRIKTSRK